MKLQLQSVRTNLKEEVEFIFLEGSVQTKRSPASDVYDGPYRKWWNVRNTRTAEVARALAGVVADLDRLGPVDGLLGFSQGATVVEMLDRLASQGVVDKTWNFSVLISAADLRPVFCKRKYASPLSVPLQCRSLHVWGRNDELGSDRMMRMAGRYASSARSDLVHDQGHMIPGAANFVEKFCQSLRSLWMAGDMIQPYMPSTAAAVASHSLTPYPSNTSYSPFVHNNDQRSTHQKFVPPARSFAFENVFAAPVVSG
ncbi:serine hydrolase-domain-containing protein [Geranomyces variabilis]|nr:serine hydrolase-domain-containing protein [Geranomyces variabilis]